MPHPYFVPVNPTFSRIAQRSGVSSSMSTLIVFPLMLMLAMACPFIGLIHREDQAEIWTGRLNHSNQENSFATWRIIDRPVLPYAEPAARPPRLSATFRPKADPLGCSSPREHDNKEGPRGRGETH